MHTTLYISGCLVLNKIKQIIKLSRELESKFINLSYKPIFYPCFCFQNCWLWLDRIVFTTEV